MAPLCRATDSGRSTVILVGEPLDGSHATRHTRLRERQGEVMPLTPEDVSNKRFTPVRLREGYDMGEVDQFLDEVESELARLTRENEDLRSKLSAAQQGGARRPSPRREPADRAGGGRRRAGARADARARADPRAGAAPAPLLRTETIKVDHGRRGLERRRPAARDRHPQRRRAGRRGPGRGRPDRRRGPHQGRAARGREQGASADRLESDARTRSQMLDSETAERRQQLFGDLEKDKEKLNGEVENLRSFEREYRSRLKSYFEQQLAALDGSGEGGDPRRRRARAEAAALAARRGRRAATRADG